MQTRNFSQFRFCRLIFRSDGIDLRGGDMVSTSIFFGRILILGLVMPWVPGGSAAAQDSTRHAAMKHEFFPIVSYDTDAGVGFGGKAFILNVLGHRESFDLTLFLSTKGERWYRLAVSFPDFELRQGTEYPVALDIVVDYDKWIASSFFGVGNESRYEEARTYTREPLEISASLSRGYTTQIVGQVGVRYKTVNNIDFPADGSFRISSPAISSSRATAISAFVTFRYDSRDSYVNPSHGLVVQAEGEFAPLIGASNVSFSRWTGWIQAYQTCTIVDGVVAARFGLQSLSADNLPVQMLLSVGGNRTVRGYTQDRFLERSAAIANVEVRLPVWWRFGAVAGFDAGKVFPSLSEFDLRRWAFSPVVGARFYMDTFVVRADVGFGAEMTGFYLNFGQLF
jgi:outer membrane protein assembly factor BamA